MTEEQGGEQIGRLFVEIGGDLRPLDEVLAQAEKRLAAVVAKEYVAKIGVEFEQTGGASPRGLVDRTGRQIGASIGQAALGEIEGKLNGTVVKDVKVETKANIDKDTLIAGIQGTLNGHKFQLNIDTEHLRRQIQEAFGNVPVGGGVAGAAAAPAAPQRSQSELFSELDKRLNAYTYKDNKAAGSLGQQIQEFGKAIFTGLGEKYTGRTPTDALNAFADRFGDDIDSWADKLEAVLPDEDVLTGLFRNFTTEKFNSKGTFYGEFLSARRGQAAAAQQQTDFINQVARKLAVERPAPKEPEQRYDYSGAALARVRRASERLVKPTSVESIIGGLQANNAETPRPSLQNLVDALLGSTTFEEVEARASQKRDRTSSSEANRGGARYADRNKEGLIVSRPTTFNSQGTPVTFDRGKTANDLEADERAESQLNINRANVRRLRQRGVIETQGFLTDLEGLFRTLERGGLRNILRTAKGELLELKPEGKTPGEVIESQLTIDELRKRQGSRKFTLQGQEGQVQFLKPRDVATEIIQRQFGGSGEGTSRADLILSDPKFQRLLSQAITQGGRNKPFDILGAGAGATRLGGQSPEATARRFLRVKELIARTDEQMADVESRLEALAGSNKPTDRLESRLSQLGVRRQELKTELEALSPFVEPRNVPAKDRALLREAQKRANAQSRESVALGVGKSPLERAIDLEKAPEVVARDIADKMAQGLVPAYDELLTRLSAAVESAVPRTEAGENQFSARFRAFAEESKKIAQDFGITDENEKPVRSRREDARVLDALIGEVKSSIFAERRTRDTEGERAVDLLNAGAGKGRRPREVIGSHVDTSKVSPQNAAVVVPDYARPTTTLDTEMATLRKKYEDEARKIAQRELDALEAERAKQPGDYDKVGINDFLFSPRIRKAGGGTTPQEIKPNVRAEVESTTEVGRRVAEIRRIQAAADEALKYQGPAVPLPSGRKRSSVDERAAFIKSLKLEPAVETEALEVARQSLSGKRTPYTKAGKEVPTGDQSREAFAAAAEGRERYPTLAASGGGAGGGRGTTEGGQFGGFPIPLPVAIVESIPLQILGAGGAAAVAASAADEAEAAVVGKAAKKGAKVSRATKDVISVTPSGVASTPTDLDIRDLAIRTARERKEAAAEEKRQAAAQAAASRPKRTGGARVLTDFDIRAEFLDQAQDEVEAISGQQRRARRLVPSRGFGASVTDALTAVFGGKGFEQQLGRLSRVETEGAELKSLRTQRAGLLAEQAVIRRRSGTATDQEREKFGARLAEISESLAGLDSAIDRSSKIITQNYNELTKGTNVLKGFVAAGAGSVGNAIAGSVTFGLGLALTGPLIQAIGGALTTAFGTGLDQILGHPGAEAQAVGTAAQLVRGTGGNRNLALAQLQAQTGNAVGQAGQVVVDRGQIEAGNQALAEQVGLIRAAIRIQKENAGRPGDLALTQSLGGFLGSSFGGIPSIDEIIGKQLQENPTITEAGKSASRERPSPFVRGATAGQLRDTGLLTPEQAKALQTNLDGLNEILKKGTGGVDQFTTSLGVSDAEIKKQAAAFRTFGAENLATAVEQRKGVLRENGQVVTDPSRIGTILTQTVKNATKLTPEDFLALQEPQIRAQQFLTRRQQKFNLQQLPIQEGLDTSANPLLPASAGISTGDKKLDQKTGISAVLPGLKQAQSVFDQLNKEAVEARQNAVAFFKEAFPGDASGAAQFSQALENSAKFGQQIAKIQLGVQTEQAALEAKQYSFQIDQAKRSLKDALGLTGKIKSETNNLGVIERQQFQLQRESQALSLQHSQQQINFQRAVAGLVAPGQTGEERAARIEQAKLETDYAQKQLDIQKKLFGLGGKQFQITADRNVQDLTRQISLLQEGREVTLHTAKASKDIQALTKLQERENKKISVFYQSAVDATGQVMQLEAQLVAQTEVDLNKVGNLVLSQFKKVYSGLLTGLLGGTSGGGTFGPSGGSGGKFQFAEGGVFNTREAANITVGEAGGETVAVLKNPRPSDFGGGGGTTIVIDLSNAQFSNEEQMRKLTRDVQRAVEEGLARKGSLFGLRR